MSTIRYRSGEDRLKFRDAPRSPTPRPASRRWIPGAPPQTPIKNRHFCAIIAIRHHPSDSPHLAVTLPLPFPTSLPPSSSSAHLAVVRLLSPSVPLLGREAKVPPSSRVQVPPFPLSPPIALALPTNRAPPRSTSPPHPTLPSFSSPPAPKDAARTLSERSPPGFLVLLRAVCSSVGSSLFSSSS